MRASDKHGRQPQHRRGLACAIGSGTADIVAVTIAAPARGGGDVVGFADLQITRLDRVS